MILPRAAIFLITIFVIPGTALGHGSIDGVGDFYSGMLHPELVPAHVLILIGLGECLKKYWQGIPARVVGSWIAASSILVLALASVGEMYLGVPSQPSVVPVYDRSRHALQIASMWR